MSESNGQPHTRVLDAPSLEACQATLRGWLATAPNPTQWGAWQRQFAWLTGEVARLTRLTEPPADDVPLAPPPVSSNGTPSGAFCDHCGSPDMMRTGPCLTCRNCGTSGGCG